MKINAPFIAFPNIAIVPQKIYTLRLPPFLISGKIPTKNNIGELLASSTSAATPISFILLFL